MKNFTLLLMGIFLFSGITNAQQRFTKTDVRKGKTEATYLHPKMKASETEFKRNAIKREEAKEVWKPLKETAYDYIGEDTWEEFATMDYEYDTKGNITANILSDNESKTKTISKYDEHNNLVEAINLSWENGEWINFEKQEYTYDDVVTDFQTSTSKYSWDASKNEWSIYYGHKKDISRNSQNYVTGISIKTLYQGTFRELQRTEITYTDGKDLPATAWTFYELLENGQGELEMLESTKYDKMKWESSDGQILTMDEEFTIGNNRLKAADIYDYQEKVATFEANYPGGSNKRDYESTIRSVTGIDFITEKLTETDDYGSFKLNVLESYDEDEDNIPEESEIYQIVNYDDHKNLILEEFYEVMEDEEEILDGYKVDYTYGTHDEIQQIIDSAFDFDLLEYVPMTKITGENFIDVTKETGIANLRTNGKLQYNLDNNNLTFSINGANHFTVYNANGTQVFGGSMNADTKSINVSQLADGLYILVVNGKEGTANTKFLKK